MGEVEEKVDMESSDVKIYYKYRALNFNQQPVCVLDLSKEYSRTAYDWNSIPKCPNSNFLKGVKWSPDGLCLSTASEDKRLRVFHPRTDTTKVSEQPDLLGFAQLGQDTMMSGEPTNVCLIDESWVWIQEGELIYDFTWYPYMSLSNPQTCCLAATCRGNPIHLWDTLTGTLRATYRAYNSVDEITAALCVSFSSCGSEIYAGYNNSIRIFKTAYQGREYDLIPTHSRKQNGQPGIISSIAPAPNHQKIFAAGSYLGTVGIYSTETGEMSSIVEGHLGGITQVAFSKDGNFLYSGARKDPTINCWDLRHLSSPLYSMMRSTGNTNQRIQFDIEPCGRLLVTGNEDGQCQFFDLVDGTEVNKITAAKDTINGSAFHPWAPMLATASGHRRLRDLESWHHDSNSCSSVGPCENTLKVWKLSSSYLVNESCAEDADKQAKVNDSTLN